MRCIWYVGLLGSWLDFKWSSIYINKVGSETWFMIVSNVDNIYFSTNMQWSRKHLSLGHCHYSKQSTCPELLKYFLWTINYCQDGLPTGTIWSPWLTTQCINWCWCGELLVLVYLVIIGTCHRGLSAPHTQHVHISVKRPDTHHSIWLLHHQSLAQI